MPKRSRNAVAKLPGVEKPISSAMLLDPSERRLHLQKRLRFLVLLALKEGPKHGYDIATHLEAKSAGFFTMSFGTLYPLLHRLEQQGLIKGEWEDGEGKRKKVYALTSAGQKALVEERARYEEQTAAFARLLGGKA